MAGGEVIPGFVILGLLILLGRDVYGEVRDRWLS